MIATSTFRYGLYVAAVTLLLTLTGIFDVFAERTVIEGLRGNAERLGAPSLAGPLAFSTVLFVGVLVGAGFLTAIQARGAHPVRTVLNGALGSLIVAVALVALTVLQTNVDLTFVFPDLKPLLGATPTLGETELGAGILKLLGASVLFGFIGGALTLVPRRVRRVLVSAALLAVVIGLLRAQIGNVVTLGDALALALAFAVGYAASRLARVSQILARVGVGLIAGAVMGVVLSLLVSSGVITVSAPSGMVSILRQAAGATLLPYVFAFGLAGALGGLATGASDVIHNGAVFFFVTLVILGLLNREGAMTPLAALLTFGLLAATMWVVPPVGERIDEHYDTLPRPERRRIQSLGFIGALIMLIVAPLFLGQNITNTINLVGLYIVMGIGLNVVVGYAGLLDLGYVAFFAIGAYTVGLLTTPSLLTCGGPPPGPVTPDNVRTLCAGVMTFWEAWPIAIGTSALAGILLGIPVLRLRGDYLAIVTLGFGEIIRLIVKFDDFKPLFGAAQGIPNIPRPVVNLGMIDPEWRFELGGAIGIYYLILIAVLLTALIALRLTNTRLGRAWRAMRADEDVAQAMGIDLVRTKLLAFAIGAAFAGMGGTIAGTQLYGAYPDSYTLLVSINVLALIIIGGLGSIPGVVVGALVLIGLPEALRELANYRLLAFGVLLVVAMLLKPEGLIPRSLPRLSEVAEDRRLKDGARP